MQELWVELPELSKFLWNRRSVGLECDEGEGELVDLACGYHFVDQEFIGFVAALISADEGEEGGLIFCGSDREVFRGEGWDPVDIELMGCGVEGSLEIEEGFWASFDHGVGDEGVAGGGKVLGELLGEFLGGVLA